MANSKYEYVRLFEQPDSLLANTWIVVRIDGRGFSKLTTKYKFAKPNDRNALDLMNAAAVAVMKELPDLVLAYGNSDEYSFVFHKDCALFERRASKLTTTITSTFTSYYVFLWSQYFPEKPLTAPLPSFDGRAVCYPSDLNLRDYMSWRQVDCHINNLYNTTFWTLVQQGGMSAQEAEQRLSGTYSADKNEILFKEFGINYNNEPECFKKGTVLYRDFFPTSADELALSSDRPQQSPAILSPRPDRSSTSSKRAVESAIPLLQDQIYSPVMKDQGATFLSTTSTPSPPPSPKAMSKSSLPNPLRSNPVSPRNNSYPPITMPLSPPTTATFPMGNLYTTSGPPKHYLPSLTPLPLSPPILKPSTKPPLSLDAPNPTTRTNFSPTFASQDFPSAYTISGYSHGTPAAAKRLVSHSASASMPGANSASIQETRVKQRSPSQPHLPTYFSSGNPQPSVPQQPPVIPLRMSSIPANTKPRKLSLQNQRSLCNLKPKTNPDDKENFMTTAQASGSTTPRRVSPPLRTNKALPSPPLNNAEEMRTREKVIGSSSPQDWVNSSTFRDSPPRDPAKRSGLVWPDDPVAHPGIAELPVPSAHKRASSVSATLTQSYQSPDMPALMAAAQTAEAPIQPTASLKDSPRSKAKAFSAKSPATATPRDVKIPARPNAELGGWAASTHASEGRPVQQSRTQKDKERKKRSKAKVLVEHVDVIKDDFWEKRPWILSGKMC